MSDAKLPGVGGILRRLTGVQIVGTGSYLPDKVVRNEDLAELGFDADWIIQRTGIRERRHAPSDMSTSHMAMEAARRCIAQAGIAKSDIDLLLLGTFTPDHLLPATACAVQHRLGLKCPATDISAACAGFMYALVTAMQYVGAGTSQCSLVIGADCNSRVTNPRDRKTYPLFGDGAGAVLLRPGSEDQGMLAYTLGSDGSGLELLYRPMGGVRVPFDENGADELPHFMHMEGRPVFKWAIRLLEETVDAVLGEARLAIDAIDLWVFHQANRRIIDAATENLGISPDKVVVHVDRYGNTSAGSVPIALDESMRSGRIQPGSKVVMSGFGAGLAWGTCVFQW